MGCEALVEVYEDGVETYIAGYINLWHVCAKEARDLGDWSDLHASAEDNDQVNKILVLFLESVEEEIWQLLPKEGDIRLHESE